MNAPEAELAELDSHYEVVVVGGGAAGVGMGIVLGQLGVPSYVILERHEVGASFRRWPIAMRFITPSFPANNFGALDLNSIAVGTSPGYTLDVEHPTGLEYAEYLDIVANYFELPIRTGIAVESIVPHRTGDGFTVETSSGEVDADFVIWAGGEFQYPRTGGFPGAEHCLHTSRVPDWQSLPGDVVTIIGGYESGIDAAVNLVRLGRKVRVLDANEPWNVNASDPSVALSPYTKGRLRRAIATGNLELVGEARIDSVQAVDNGFLVRAEDGRQWSVDSPPLLATGFGSSALQHYELFDWEEDGLPRLSEVDESTVTPGLFLIGPSVRQDAVHFCFIYKFRQRFAVVANAIGGRLGIDTAPLEFFRQYNMYLDDLSCCTIDCVC